MALHPAGLVVGGYACPTSGAIAVSTIPQDNRYYLTTFGGGTDTQGMSCGGTADGSWYYLADASRWPCGTKIRISANGQSCIAQVADIGPNVCVEQAAGMPVIDASPVVAQYLFGTPSLGWSSRQVVTATIADPSLPLGPDASYVPGSDANYGSVMQAGFDLTGLAVLTVVGTGAYLILRALKVVR